MHVWREPEAECPHPNTHPPTHSTTGRSLEVEEIECCEPLEGRGEGRAGMRPEAIFAAGGEREELDIKFCTGRGGDLCHTIPWILSFLPLR